MKTPIPATVNIHSLRLCNYSCGYCYAGFQSTERGVIPQSELHEILKQLARSQLIQSDKQRKVTFAGGEPLLVKTLVGDVAYAKSQGLVTSIVTNGFFLTESILKDLAPTLDWLCISIDALEIAKNIAVGRSQRGIALSAKDYLSRINHARRLGIKIKINTVVSSHNHTDDFNCFIQEAMPVRWKIFQVSEISGENDIDFNKWKVSGAEFQSFVDRHKTLEDKGIILVPETQEVMRGTYAMIAPNGCFYDNSLGSYKYSQPIVNVGIEEAFSNISFSLDRFEKRQGDYNFQTGQNW